MAVVLNSDLDEVIAAGAQQGTFYDLRHGYGGYLNSIIQQALVRGDVVLRLDVSDWKMLLNCFEEMNLDEFEFESPWSVSYDSHDFAILFCGLTDAVTFRFRYPGSVK